MILLQKPISLALLSAAALLLLLPIVRWGVRRLRPA